MKPYSLHSVILNISSKNICENQITNGIKPYNLCLCTLTLLHFKREKFEPEPGLEFGPPDLNQDSSVVERQARYLEVRVPAHVQIFLLKCNNICEIIIILYTLL